MDVWWIILACCVGGLLLFGYIGIVLYKTCQQLRSGNTKHDPENPTDDKVWTTDVNKNELTERKEDGLCLDTQRRSRIYHRSSICDWPIPKPAASPNPSSPESVLKSVLKIGVLVMAPANIHPNTTDGTDNDENDKKSVSPLQGTTESLTFVNEKTKQDEQNAMKSAAPDVVQVMPKDSLADRRHRKDRRQIKRSETFHWDYLEYENPVKQSASTHSLETHRKRDNAKRSKSLKEKPRSKSLGPSSANNMTLTVKSDERNLKQMTKKKTNKDQQKAAKLVKRRKPEEGELTPKHSKLRRTRSDSAPSAIEVADSEFNNESTNAPPRRSHSLRWIPEPDYHSISIEKIITEYSKTKNGQREVSSGKDQVCTVVVHNTQSKEQVPRESKLVSSVSAEKRSDDSVTTSPEVFGAPLGPTSQHPTSAHGDQQEQSTTIYIEKQSDDSVDTGAPEVFGAPMGLASQHPISARADPQHEQQPTSIYAVPGMAERLPADASSDGGEQDQPTIIDIDVEKRSDDSVPSSLEVFGAPLSPPSQHPTSSRTDQQEQPSSISVVPWVAKRLPADASESDHHITSSSNGSSNGKQNESSSIENARKEKSTDNAIELNSTPTNNSWNEEQPTPAEDLRVETCAVKNITQLPPRTEQSLGVRTIGNMTIVKHGETPTRKERPLEIVRNEESTPKYSVEPTTSRQVHDVTISGKASEVSRPSDDTRPVIITINQDEAKEIRHKNITALADNSRALSKVLVKGAQVPSTEPKPFTSEIVAKALAAKERRAKEDDIDLNIEERKRNWKREQIVDKLNSARTRNMNSNYIFGTGLAYQTCMPELQDKLKRLSLAK